MAVIRLGGKEGAPHPQKWKKTGKKWDKEEAKKVKLAVVSC